MDNQSTPQSNNTFTIEFTGSELLACHDGLLLLLGKIAPSIGLNVVPIGVTANLLLRINPLVVEIVKAEELARQERETVKLGSPEPPQTPPANNVVNLPKKKGGRK
jgi:hypothetical protein